jgi:hypothetical protein
LLRFRVGLLKLARFMLILRVALLERIGMVAETAGAVDTAVSVTAERGVPAPVERFLCKTEIVD